jgi:hypothetical protein
LVNFHSLGEVQLEFLEEDSLGPCWLSDAAFPDHCALFGGHDHVYYFDLGNLVEDLARLISQSRPLAHLAQHLP